MRLYFGGKARVAPLIWDRLGDPDNVIEPFCGSAAFLLARPHPPRIETINDADCFVSNFWRATQRDPEAVAAYADWPVNEADLHSRHRWLVLSEDARAFRQRMRTDPDYFDAKVAGWWCWGLCQWIGAGWCSSGIEWQQTPLLADAGNSIDAVASGAGRVKGLREKKPGVAGNSAGKGIHVDSAPTSDRPFNGTHRPQLADAYSRGRGVHNDNHLDQKRPELCGGNGPSPGGVHNRPELGTCAQRRAWLVDWFSRLRDRLRTVRVCCGDWRRVCDSDSVTTRLGTVGIMFDPPYSAEAGRDMSLYGVESGDVAHDVRAYCLERGADPQYRIALCGYEGEGHEELEARGWECVAWRAQGGYGNRSEKGKENAGRERLWFSPFTTKKSGLFDGIRDD